MSGSPVDGEAHGFEFRGILDIDSRLGAMEAPSPNGIPLALLI
jgi:hypothetical protein